MSIARLVITAVVTEGRSKSEVARDYRVSRRWVQKLLLRYAAEGEAAFTRRSRRPIRSPQRTPAQLEDEIVALRKELARAGHDAGAATIAFHLASRHGGAPAVSTIWRILVERGFVTPQPHKRPRSSWTRFEADQPNERWQADVTHWRLADGTEVEVCNQLDDHSRFCVGSDAAVVVNGPALDAMVRRSTARHGFPASYLTDNGAVFTGSYRRGGMVSFERLLAANRVRLRHSTPYHPQTCGKVERFHQTLKRWLARQRRARSVSELQRQLDTFRAYYNETRPHRALGRRTPAQAYAARPKATPDAAAFTAPRHHRVRHDRIDKAGVVTLRHNSRLHHIGVGRGHAGTHVRLLVDELHVRVITEDGELLRELTLDPTRDYQPQAKT
ncbi:MAG: IS481 family transposase [Mycobacteriales bacterium]